MGFSLKDFLRGSINRGKRRRHNANVKGTNFHTHTRGGLTDGPITNYEQYGDGHSFRSHINKTQLATTERFECQFYFPPGVSSGDFSENCTLMCEEVQIPGMVLANKEFNVGQWTHYRNTNMQFLGNEINFTFYTPADWIHRAKFESWMAYCVNPTSKEVRFPQHTWGEISINALDKQNNYRSSWHLYEVTPKVLNLIPLSMGAVGVARTTLIVSATYWESKAIEVHMGRPSARTVNPAVQQPWVVPHRDKNRNEIYHDKSASEFTLDGEQEAFDDEIEFIRTPRTDEI